MRKIINSVDEVVPDYLNGLARAHPDIVAYDPSTRLLHRAEPAKKNGSLVGLVAGGGSGCEPLHAGYVGRGMLDAACQGEVFTSPVPRQIVRATLDADTGAGVLHIVKNFSGEVMNFGMAAELLAFDDVTVASVLVNDDCSIADDGQNAGRRGLGTTVFVEKIAGAAAERGWPLPEVTRVAEKVVTRSRSFAVALSSCTPPMRGRPIFDMPEDSMEVGVGISGEPGRERVPRADSVAIASLMVSSILHDRPISAGSGVLVLVSGMGATPSSELHILFNDVFQNLAERGIPVSRSLVGNFLTSLDQAGAALTILELDSELTELWDDPVHTASLRWGC